MVSLNASVAKFGSPPDPDKPELLYPGISARKFDRVQASKVFSENLEKEKTFGPLWARQGFDWLESEKRPRRTAAAGKRVLDIMPGYASLAELYASTGWPTNSTTGRLEEPSPKTLAAAASSPALLSSGAAPPRQPARAGFRFPQFPGARSPFWRGGAEESGAEDAASPSIDAPSPARGGRGGSLSSSFPSEGGGCGVVGKFAAAGPSEAERGEANANNIPRGAMTSTATPSTKKSVVYERNAASRSGRREEGSSSSFMLLPATESEGPAMADLRKRLAERGMSGGSLSENNNRAAALTVTERQAVMAEEQEKLTRNAALGARRCGVGEKRRWTQYSRYAHPHLAERASLPENDGRDGTQTGEEAPAAQAQNSRFAQFAQRREEKRRSLALQVLGPMEAPESPLEERVARAKLRLEKQGRRRHGQEAAETGAC